MTNTPLKQPLGWKYANNPNAQAGIYDGIALRAQAKKIKRENRTEIFAKVYRLIAAVLFVIGLILIFKSA